MIVLFILFGLAQSHLIPQTTEAPPEPKVIIQGGNYTVSLVPLVTLILSSISRFAERFRPQSRKIEIPGEFNGANPCLDSILIRKKYPGSQCHFYQCQIYEEGGPLCRLQAIDEDMIKVDEDTVADKINVRINKCLTIEIYKCRFGFVYSEQAKQCVKHDKFNINICPAYFY